MTLKIGRNDLCHCGSKKKYKKCHLEADEKKDRKEREKAALNAAKVMAEKVESQEKGKDSSSSGSPDVHKRHPDTDQSGWIGKMANKVGFLKNVSQKRLPSGNKGG